MATISGSTTSSASAYNQLVASNKGIGGLASGLDTDSLVEAMVLGTRNKIAAQYQARTKLQWQMTAYRSVAADLRTFQNKWLSSSTPSTNLGSYAFWNVNKATASSDAVSVTAGSTAIAGNIEIQAIKSVASAQTISSRQLTQDLTGEALDGTKVLDTIGKTMQVSYNGTTRTIKLDDLDGMTVGTDDALIESTLNDLFDKAFGANMVKASVDETYAGSGEYAITIEPVLDTATVIVTNNVDELGFAANTGNRIPTGTTIGDMDWGSGYELIGDTFTFTINGVTFSFDRDTKMSEVVTKIQQSSAGVTLSWDAVNQCYTLAANNTGSGEAIVMEDVEGNFLNTLFGARSGNSVSSGGAIYDQFDPITGTMDLSAGIEALLDEGKTAQEIADYLSHCVFNLTIGGTTAGMTLTVDADTVQQWIDSNPGNNAAAGAGIAGAIVQSLNDQIEEYFGADIASKVEFSINPSTGEVSFAADTAEYVELAAYSDSTYFDALNVLFGFEDGSGNDFVSQSNNMVQGWSMTVASDYAVDVQDMYMNSAGGSQTYEMEVTINGRTETITVEIDLDDIGGINTTYYDTTTSTDISVTTYSDLLAAINHFSSPGTFDQDEIDRLTAIKDTFEANLATTGVADLESKLNDALSTAFGSDADALSFTVAADGSVSLNSSDSSVDFSISQSTTGANDLFVALNFDKDEDGNTTATTSLTNDKGSTLGEIAGVTGGNLTFSVGGGTPITVAYTTSMTMQELVNEINAAAGSNIASLVDGKLTISGGTQDLSISDDGGLLESIAGYSSYTTQAADYTAAGATNKEGTNTVVIIDGAEVSYATTSFTYKGVTIEVNETFNWTETNGLDEKGDPVTDPVTGLPTGGAGYVDSNDKITIRVSTDTDEVVDAIKDFIEDYNAMIDMLYSYISESKVDGYDPLTDEQKAEMTETEIANWEAEAKKGLLRSDSTLRSIMDQMRSTMYTKTSPDGLALYDLGITTMSIFSSSGTDYSNSGKLELTEEGEAQLREMLETNIDGVRELFVSNEEGTSLIDRMNTIITDACNESTGAHGSLVRLAGTDTLTGDNESYLGNRIEAIDEYIAKLTTRLENEYNRYWAQFTALETAISRMNSQMSYLDSLFS